MPHLSPLNWLLAPILFWSLLISFSSLLWWSQLPYMPSLSATLYSSSSSSWPW